MNGEQKEALKNPPKKRKSNKSEPTYKSPTPCICPRCCREHVKMLFWTGRGTPRAYCPDCQHIEEVQSPEPVYCVNKRALYANEPKEI
jgi:hypothetical protein